MLSFFRKKSTSDPVDGLVSDVGQLSTSDTVRSASCEEAMDSLELAKQLGYGSLVELKETIYGNIYK